MAGPARALPVKYARGAAATDSGLGFDYVHLVQEWPGSFCDTKKGCGAAIACAFTACLPPLRAPALRAPRTFGCTTWRRLLSDRCAPHLSRCLWPKDEPTTGFLLHGLWPEFFNGQSVRHACAHTRLSAFRCMEPAPAGCAIALTARSLRKGHARTHTQTRILACAHAQGAGRSTATTMRPST